MNSIDKRDKLDSVLLEQDTLLPSSGFAQSVMDTIQQEAAAPAPLPFPWKLALPGLGLVLIGFAGILWFMLYKIPATDLAPSIEGEFIARFHWNSENVTLLQTQIGQALLAVIASLVCVALFLKLAGGRSTR